MQIIVPVTLRLDYLSMAEAVKMINMHMKPFLLTCVMDIAPRPLADLRASKGNTELRKG